MGTTNPPKQEFLAAVTQLVEQLGWQLRSFESGGEVIALAALAHDPTFEQMLWIYSPEGRYVRCLLVARGNVSGERENAVVELCARINDGLVLGCAEYSFADSAFAFRASFEARLGQWEQLEAASARLLQLGVHYAPALKAVFEGASARAALDALERKNEEGSESS